MSTDPTVTDPDKYKAIFENERVRVLEYKDKPGDRTSPHRHPDSVMYTLSSFRRRLVHGDRAVDVELEAGHVGWLDAQEHHGENIGDTDTHVLFIELKDGGSWTAAEPEPPLGPSSTP
jgi:quercetin dioxygenase-like cupin family protein